MIGLPVAVFLDPQCARDVGVDLARADTRCRAPAQGLRKGAQRRLRIALGGCAIGGLRSLVEACRRLACRVRGGKIAPTVARIICRRLQAGLMTSFALVPPPLRGRAGEGSALLVSASRP